MSTKINGIDANQILDNELRINILDSILGYILHINPNIIKPSDKEIDSIEKAELEKLKKKYPHIKFGV